MEPSARREITWSELFDAAVVVTGVDREEVFEPGNVRVRVTASSAEHGGGTGALHHLELRAHIYGGETWGQLILWNTGTPALLNTHTHTHMFADAGTWRNLGWRPTHIESTSLISSFLHFLLICLTLKVNAWLPHVDGGVTPLTIQLPHTVSLCLCDLVIFQ